MWIIRKRRHFFFFLLSLFSHNNTFHLLHWSFRDKKNSDENNLRKIIFYCCCCCCCCDNRMNKKKKQEKISLNLWKRETQTQTKHMLESNKFFFSLFMLNYHHFTLSWTVSVIEWIYAEILAHILYKKEEHVEQWSKLNKHDIH